MILLLGAPAKFWNPMATHSGILGTAAVHEGYIWCMKVILLFMKVIFKKNYQK